MGQGFGLCKGDWRATDKHQSPANPAPRSWRACGWSHGAGRWSRVAMPLPSSRSRPCDRFVRGSSTAVTPWAGQGALPLWPSS